MRKITAQVDQIPVRPPGAVLFRGVHSQQASELVVPVVPVADGAEDLLRPVASRFPTEPLLDAQAHR